MKKNLRSSFNSLKLWIYLHLLLMLASIGFGGFAGSSAKIIILASLLGVLSFLLYLIYLNSLIKLFDSILKTSVFDDLKNDD